MYQLAVFGLDFERFVLSAKCYGVTYLPKGSRFVFLVKPSCGIRGESWLLSLPRSMS